MDIEWLLLAILLSILRRYTAGTAMLGDGMSNMWYLCSPPRSCKLALQDRQTEWKRLFSCKSNFRHCCNAFILSAFSSTTRREGKPQPVGPVGGKSSPPRPAKLKPCTLARLDHDVAMVIFQNHKLRHDIYAYCHNRQLRLSLDMPRSGPSLTLGGDITRDCGDQISH